MAQIGGTWALGFFLMFFKLPVGERRVWEYFETQERKEMSKTGRRERE